MLYNVYSMKMKRTQLYLKPITHQNVAREARRRRCTMAQIMRERLEEDFDAPTQKRGAAGLLAMAERARKRGARGPRDLSENLDYYLYGEGRIE